jgi:hypothetical protein
MIARDLKPGQEFYFAADLRRKLFIKYIRCEDNIHRVHFVECGNGSLVYGETALMDFEVELAENV